MNSHFSPRDDVRARVTLRLQDFAQADRERTYPAPRAGDWILLVLLVLILLGNGVYVWHQRGWDDAIGRAVFFGLALICLYWTAAVSLFKLSLGVRVGPQGLSLVRGPWRTELGWAEIERLAERTEVSHGQRYRWVVATAYDGRRLQVREDMLTNYAEFRIEVYERHRLWQEHGGTWGTNGGGPYVASERIGAEVQCWLIAAGAFLLPASYFLALLPGVPFAGPALLALALACLLLMARAVLLRQRYSIDPKQIECRRALRAPVRLGWREIARVERAHRASGFLVRAGVGLARLALALATRNDVRTRAFAWSPRVPDYLILRGGGRQISIRLHRLERPDELLAWVEFYERMGRAGERKARSSAPVVSRPVPELVPAELSGAFGPTDPWAGGRGGEPAAASGTGSPPAAPSQPSNAARPANAPKPTAAETKTAAEPLAQRIPGFAPVPPAPPEASYPSSAAIEPGEDAWLRETLQQPWVESTDGSTASAVDSRSQPADNVDAAPTDAASSTPGRESGNLPPQMPLAPGMYPGEWDIPDELPEDGENEPTDAVEGLAESFAPWRDDNAPPPPLPRYGPPARTEHGTN